MFLFTASRYSNIHLYRSGETHSFDVALNKLTPYTENPERNKIDRWPRWYRVNESRQALGFSSAVCTLYAKYLTDQLRKEGKGTIEIGMT